MKTHPVPTAVLLRLVTACFALVAAVLVTACAGKSPVGVRQQMPDRENRMKKGYVYYLDGAGGGTAKNNWGKGVRDGMLAAGYPGAGELFSWELGEGMLKDQDASVDYKRGKAGALAREITQRSKSHPGVPIELLGFSAGTAIAVFALEALPEQVKVQNVVLLGASISHDYDLTKALRHVKGHLYLYTSTRDRMVGFWMRFSGSADRKMHDEGADIHGFVLPAGATAETKKLYAQKIVAIKWTKELEADGDYGHHFDNVKMPFIRDHVAPLLMNKPVPGLKQTAKAAR